MFIIVVFSAFRCTVAQVMCGVLAYLCGKYFQMVKWTTIPMISINNNNHKFKGTQPYESMTPTEGFISNFENKFIHSPLVLSVAIKVCRENLRLQKPKNALPGTFELMQRCWIELVPDRITFDELDSSLQQLASGSWLTKRRLVWFLDFLF